MLIPKNGRIVIVDDSLAQAYPLIKALSFKKLPFTYHTEKKDQLPQTPYQDVRLIFLDINLTEGVNTEAAISSQLQTTLEHIISPGTPYIAAIWSIKENEYQDLLTELFNNKIPQLKPLTQISLAKSELFSVDVDNGGQYIEDDSVDIIEVINTKLTTEIDKINSFKALIIWETIIQDCAQETVHQFSKIVTNDEFWHNNLKHILYKMAHAQLGQTIVDVTEEEILQAALRTLTSSFEGKVESKLNDSALMINDIDIKNEGPVFTTTIDGVKVELKWDNVKKWIAYFNTTQKAESTNVLNLKNSAADNVILNKLKDIYKTTSPKLNKELLISNAGSPVLYPGNVYLKTVTDIQKREYVKTYFKHVAAKSQGQNPQYTMADADLDMFRLVEMECTPLCDFSQKKRLRTRILPGLLYSAKVDKEINSGDSYYQEIPPFEYEGEVYKLVFDYRLFKSHNIEKGNLHPDNFLFKLKNEVVTDVLARISAHVNRPGITTIS